MNEATPRVWFLSPLDALGSFRVGVCVMLGLWATALAAALLVGFAIARARRFLDDADQVDRAAAAAGGGLHRVMKQADLVALHQPLVGAFLKGDPGAFERLDERHRLRLERLRGG